MEPESLSANVRVYAEFRPKHHFAKKNLYFGVMSFFVVGGTN